MLTSHLHRVKVGRMNLVKLDQCTYYAVRIIYPVIGMNFGHLNGQDINPSLDDDLTSDHYEGGCLWTNE